MLRDTWSLSLDALNWLNAVQSMVKFLSVYNCQGVLYLVGTSVDIDSFACGCAILLPVTVERLFIDVKIQLIICNFVMVSLLNHHN